MIDAKYECTHTLNTDLNKRLNLILSHRYIVRHSEILVFYYLGKITKRLLKDTAKYTYIKENF